MKTIQQGHYSQYMMLTHTTDEPVIISADTETIEAQIQHILTTYMLECM